MKTKEKYYIPEIEEFHVGFEFEQNTGYEWVKRIFKDLGGIYSLENAINQKMVRVKYLDKEDIESLGFIPDKERAWGIRMCFYKDDITLDINEDYSVFINKHNSPIKTLFQGTVKNKSELKRLMKQLNIIK